jgi:hypothetical protein
LIGTDPDPAFYAKYRSGSNPNPDQGFDQGCGSGSGTGSGSVLDPYSIGSVDPDPYSESDKSRKKFVKVHVLKCWMASFES